MAGKRKSKLIGAKLIWFPIQLEHPIYSKLNTDSDRKWTSVMKLNATRDRVGGGSAREPIEMKMIYEALCLRLDRKASA